MNSSNIDPRNSIDRSPALRAFLLIAVLLLSLGVMSPRSEAAVTLDPNNPSNFTKDGTQTFTIGSVLTLTDANVGDFIAFLERHLRRVEVRLTEEPVGQVVESRGRLRRPTLTLDR